MAMPRSKQDVSYIKRELLDVLSRYELIDDVLNGSDTIKGKTTTYLPTPNIEVRANEQRYQSYLTRAVFYPVTRKTLSGFLGQIFLRDPQITLPAEMAFLEHDADGNNVNLIQFSKHIASLNLSHGRAGILVDFPNIDSDVLSKADIDEGFYEPSMTAYHPAQIINWRTKKYKGKTLLSLVVLQETYYDYSHEFAEEAYTRFRVLKLNDDNIYTVTLYTYPKLIKRYTKTFNFDDGIKSETLVPRSRSGKPFNEIPFVFVGSEQNTPDINPQPLYDMSEVNLAHYRNSADHEDATFLLGQPTPVVTGLSIEFAERFYKDKKIYLGSRAPVVLPPEGNAYLLQANPNNMVTEAMQAKERQMIALGARLVEQRLVQRTATEASNDVASEKSVLATVADNVSNAVERALRYCAIFIYENPKPYLESSNDNSNNQDAQKPENTLSFILNTQFDLMKLSPEERRQLISDWQAGALTTEELRHAYRAGGLAYEPDDRYLVNIAKQNELKLEEKVKETKALNDAAPKPSTTSAKP